jgi:hypothetical protein
MKKVAKTLALVAGALLLLIGGLAFFPLGVLGPDGLVISYAGVPWVYVASGLLLMAFSRIGETWAATGLYTVAFAHLLLAGLGYANLNRAGVASLFDVLKLTPADLVLHGLIAVSLAVCGKLNTARQQVIWD